MLGINGVNRKFLGALGAPGVDVLDIEVDGTPLELIAHTSTRKTLSIGKAINS
ncbi:hypothetical protein D3C73_746090 [compost metagenome]